MRLFPSPKNRIMRGPGALGFHQLCTSNCGISCLISKSFLGSLITWISFVTYSKLLLFKTSSKRSKSFESAGVISHFLNFLNIMALTAGCFYMKLQIAGRNCQNIINFSRNWSCISWKIEIMMQAIQKSSSKYTYAKKVHLFNLIGRWFWEMCCD